jgi:hypothetical protein
MSDLLAIPKLHAYKDQCMHACMSLTSAASYGGSAIEAASCQQHTCDDEATAYNPSRLMIN